MVSAFMGRVRAAGGLSGIIFRFDLNDTRDDVVLEGALEDRVDDNAEKG